MRNNWFVFPDFFSRNVGNSIKCEKNITPPPPPTFEIQNQNKGIEDIYNGYRFQLSLSTIWRNHLPFNQ